MIELLIVLAILGFLASLIAPRVIGYLGRAKSDIAVSQLSNLATSLELYYLDMGQYPTSDEGLESLVKAPPGNDLWLGPYLKEESALNDPWGEPYKYSVDGDSFRIWSLGRDGEEGGAGEDRDLSKS